MKRLAKNLIVTVLIFGTVFAANLSLAESSFESVYYSGENNSEFWEKFKESVMPDDDKNKGKIPNYEKNPPPPPQKPSRNKAM